MYTHKLTGDWLLMNKDVVKTDINFKLKGDRICFVKNKDGTETPSDIIIQDKRKLRDQLKALDELHVHVKLYFRRSNEMLCVVKL